MGFRPIDLLLDTGYSMLDAEYWIEELGRAINTNLKLREPYRHFAEETINKLKWYNP